MSGRPTSAEPRNTAASTTSGRDGLDEVHERTAAENADHRSDRETDRQQEHRARLWIRPRLRVVQKADVRPRRTSSQNTR